MKQRNRARTLAASLFVVSALTACGSTVQTTGSLSVAGGSDGLSGTQDGAGTTGGSPDAGSTSTGGSGLTGTGGTDSLAAGGTTGSGTGGGTGGGTSGGSSSGTGGSSGGTGGSGSSAGGTSGGTGATSVSSIGVLFFYVNGGNQALSSVFPGSSVSFGDGKGEANAVIADINAKGGINGRKIKPFFVPIEATNTRDDSVGTACQGAVQDNHPFAILSIFNISRPLVECAKKNNVLLLDVALGAGDDGVYKNAPDLAFSPTQISRDLEQRLVLGLAHSSGTLNAKTPVGILSETDDPQFTNVVSKTIVPLLKGWGVPYTEATISNGADSSGLSAAVLKFRGSGVKYVTFSLGAGGIPEVLFMQNANQQNFSPKYLMGDSTDTSFVQSSAPKAQAMNISGAGTYPLANVAAADYPSSPGETHCFAVLNKSIGGYRNRGSSLTGTLACELLYGFTFIAKRVPGQLTAASFVQAYRAVGTAYPALTTFTSNLTGARNDNAAAYRTFTWQTACSCLKYTSAAKPITAVTG